MNLHALRIGVWSLAAACQSFADEGTTTFETLRVGSNVYYNAEVLTKNATDVYFRHDGGMMNFKATNLALEVQEKLGYYVPKPPPASESTLAKLKADPRMQEIELVKERVAQQLESKIALLGPALLAGILGGFLLFYVFVCYCFSLICKRAGTEPGSMIWLPVLQMFPLLKAAGMPAWWFLLFLIFPLSVIAQLVWSLKIAQACGKSAGVGFLLFFPLTWFFTLMYLAFAKDPSGAAPPVEDGRLKLA